MMSAVLCSKTLKGMCSVLTIRTHVPWEHRRAMIHDGLPYPWDLIIVPESYPDQSREEEARRNGGAKGSGRKCLQLWPGRARERQEWQSWLSGCMANYYLSYKQENSPNDEKFCRYDLGQNDFLKTNVLFAQGQCQERTPLLCNPCSTHP